MGTRADFYVGKGKDAQWIGSIAWDGYRDGISEAVLKAETETQFIDAVKDFFKGRDDVTTPEMGWPWPWDDSSISDCSYWFFDDQVWDEYGGKYVPCSLEMGWDWDETDVLDDKEKIDFPHMKNGECSAAPGSNRSGVMVIGI